MNSGKDIVGSVADVLVVAGLIAATFIYQAPAVFVALLAYGAFRHIYAGCCVDNKIKGSQFLCYVPFWNVLDILIVAATLVTGFAFVNVSMGWQYFGAMLYVALRHVVYSFGCSPPSGWNPPAKSYHELTNVALDFAVAAFFVHSIFMLVDTKDGEILRSSHCAGAWALFGLVSYVLFRHIYSGCCIDAKLTDAQYLSEHLFYNVWDLLVIVTCFSSGFIWQNPWPFVVGVVLVCARFIYWSALKYHYPPTESVSAQQQR